MGAAIMARPKKIMVAVKFEGPHCWRLTVEAAALARKWEASLHLVHVLEPWGGDAFTNLLGASASQADLTAAVGGVQARAAWLHMEELVEGIGTDLKVETSVIRGPLVASLIEAAKVSQADLIVTGRQEAPGTGASYKNVPTSLGLVGPIDIPFLMLPEKTAMSLSKKSLRVLLCDDLTHASEPAVAMTRELCRAFEHSEVLHLHINTLKEAEFLAEIDKAITPKSNGAYNYRDLYQRGLAAVKSTLEARGREEGSGRNDENLCCQWVSVAKEADDIGQAIDDEAKSRSVDLIVFGRHRYQKAMPHGIGRLAYAQMLHCQKAVLIVGAHCQEAAPWRNLAKGEGSKVTASGREARD